MTSLGENPADSEPFSSRYFIEPHLAVLDKLAKHPEDELARHRALDGMVALEEQFHSAHPAMKPQELWDLTAIYLQKLNTLPEEARFSANAQSQATQLYQRLIESLDQTSLSESNASSYLMALETIINSDNFLTKHGAVDLAVANHHEFKKIDNRKLKQRHRSLLRNPEFYGSIGDFFMKDGRIDNDNFSRRKEVFEDVVRGLGFDDAEAMLRSCSYRRKNRLPKIETQNLFYSISQLEAQRPGAAKSLHDFYGIRGFHRYPTHLLAEQYDMHGQADRPYGVVCAAADDHNGAFGRQPPAGLTEVQATYDLRFIEAANNIDLGRRLLNLDKLYGQQQKISFMVVEAHGLADRVLMDVYDRHSAIGSVSLNTKIKKSRRQLFAPKPLIILNSCSTGKEGGIAGRLSARLDATVVAPAEDAATKKIVVGEGQPLKLEPVYSRPYELGGPEPKLLPAALYKDGRKITGEQYAEYFAEANRTQ